MAKMTREEFFDHLDEHREHALDVVGADENASMTLQQWLAKLAQGMKSVAEPEEESSDGDDLVGDDDDMLVGGEDDE